MSVDPERHVKGSVMRGYLKYIERSWGLQGLDEMTGSTGISSSDIIEGEWYDLWMPKNILKWIAESKGLKYVKMAGNYAVKDLGLLSYIMRFTDINSLLKRASKNYHQAYDFGDVEVIYGEKEALIKMTDAAYDEYACLAWEGAFQGMLEMTHTDGRVTKTSCEIKGDGCCEYHLQWK